MVSIWRRIEYRTEEDVFDDFSPEKRSKLFGKHPATVWENMQAFKKYPQKTAVITRGDVLKPVFVNSFAQGALIRWQTELLTRLIPENHDLIVSMKKLHKAGDPTLSWDNSVWDEIQKLRVLLAKDTSEKLSVFTKIRKAVAEGDFALASSMQVEMQEKIEELKKLYHDYASNIID